MKKFFEEMKENMNEGYVYAIEREVKRNNWEEVKRKGAGVFLREEFVGDENFIIRVGTIDKETKGYVYCTLEIISRNKEGKVVRMCKKDRVPNCCLVAYIKEKGEVYSVDFEKTIKC